jgi:hypothetical protein
MLVVEPSIRPLQPSLVSIIVQTAGCISTPFRPMPGNTMAVH